MYAGAFVLPDVTGFFAGVRAGVRLAADLGLDVRLGAFRDLEFAAEDFDGPFFIVSQEKVKPTKTRNERYI